MVSLLKLPLKVEHSLPDRGIHLHAIFDQSAGMQDRAVIPSSKSTSNHIE